ncbi:MAG: hypothetical protein RIQ81_865 [Pseudomonadota bacterium]
MGSETVFWALYTISGLSLLIASTMYWISPTDHLENADQQGADAQLGPSANGTVSTE